jgi:hypothetical protein
MARKVLAEGGSGRNKGSRTVLGPALLFGDNNAGLFPAFRGVTERSIDQLQSRTHLKMEGMD